MTDTVTGPVTLDDVRGALAGVDPNNTNAGAVRRALGRGSMSTIQRHLDALRAEGAPQAQEVGGPVPDAPRDLMSALWSHAWTAAQARTSGTLAAAQALQATTAAALVVAQADAAAAQAEADDAAQAQELARQQAQQAQEAYATALAEVQALAEAQNTRHAEELATLRTALDHAQQAAALERAEHAAAMATLRGEVDRLVNQLADLRAALGRSAA